MGSQCREIAAIYVDYADIIKQLLALTRHYAQPPLRPLRQIGIL